MKGLLIAAILVGSICASTPARQAPAHQAELDAVVAKLRGALRANQKDAVAELISFPVEAWSTEVKGEVRTEGVKDRADLLARYSTLVPPFMRSHVARAKLAPLSDGRYSLTWTDANAEFGFDIAWVEGVGYRVQSYTIGPR